VRPICGQGAVERAWPCQSLATHRPKNAVIEGLLSGHHLPLEFQPERFGDSLKRPHVRAYSTSFQTGNRWLLAAKPICEFALREARLLAKSA
jgi:hypothetical protein